MESLSEQPVYRGFSNYAKIRNSRQVDLHGVNNLVHLLVRKPAYAGFYRDRGVGGPGGARAPLPNIFKIIKS